MVLTMSFLRKSNNGLLGVNTVAFFRIFIIIGNMCQQDHGKYCIKYRSRYGLLGLNRVDFWKKSNTAHALLDWNHVFLKKFKVALSPSRKVVFISSNESSLKIMKNVFCFMLKALFVLEIFTFLYRIFGYVEKRAW